MNVDLLMKINYKFILSLPFFIFAQEETKLLMVLTNTAIDDKGQSTGFWFSELTHFYHVFDGTEFHIDFVSPKGGNAPIDPTSIENLDEISLQYYEDTNFKKSLTNTNSPSEINVKDYSVIYFVGGHGAMWDFSDDSLLQKITTQIYENNGIASAVCHGTAGLLNTKLSNGNYLIQNKEITGFSNIEESIVGKTNSVPFLLQDKIENRNGNYNKNFIPFTSNVVIDGRIITGQNPNSTTEVAKAILDYLNR